VFLQRFDGAVTIWPRTRFWDWFRLLSDPDVAELDRMIRVGEIVTWPKLHMIENRAKIENQIYLGRKTVRKALQIKPIRPESSTLRGNTSTAPALTGSDLPLSVDSEAEAAIAHGSRQTSFRGPPDHLRASVIRRKWAPETLHTTATSGDQCSNKQSVSGRSLFSRLRTKSFQAIPSPFSRSHESVIDSAEQTWSSDSSFGDDISLDGRRYSHLSTEDIKGDYDDR